MRKTFTIRISCLFVCFVIALFSIVPSFALDDSYRIDEMEMTLKIPKEYTVITRTTDKNDAAFSKLGLNYDETMTAFSLDNIYLQAIGNSNGLKINLRQITDDNSKEINNYSDLSEAQREEALNVFLKNEMCVSGVEIKHNDNIFFDLNVLQKTQVGNIYIYQCHTVINGMNIDLTLEKQHEALTADEIKIVTNIANSFEFDEIYLKNGPAFEWWRLLLWIVVLVVVAIAANYLYRTYNSKHKNIKTRRISHSHGVDVDSSSDEKTEMSDVSNNKRSLLKELGFDDNDEMTFDELLGYDKTDYYSRSNSEMDSYDIKVKSKRQSSVSYFEEDEKRITKKGDYFDEFFNDNDEHKNEKNHKGNVVVFYVKKAFRHLKYFCINVWRLIFPSKKSKRRR